MATTTVRDILAFVCLNTLTFQGYVVDFPIPKTDKKTKRLLVCASCARSMRGRFKLERVSDNIDFACAMGNGESVTHFKLLHCGKISSIFNRMSVCNICWWVQ